MDTFIYLVSVEASTREQADQVMNERLSCDEDYGFDYTVDYTISEWRRELPGKAAN